MNKITISIAVLSFFLFGCAGTSSEKSKDETETNSHNEHGDSVTTSAIELNNGEKWKVNEEMMPAIDAMEKDINDFASSETKEYKPLVEKLQSNVDLLISNCTMEGKGHDELHKWLLPYMALVKELSEAKDENEAAVKFKNIEQSMVTLNTYFQ